MIPFPHVHTTECVNMCSKSILHKSKTWKQPKCSILQRQTVYGNENEKKKQHLWISNIMLNKINQAQNNVYCMVFLWSSKHQATGQQCLGAEAYSAMTDKSRRVRARTSGGCQLQGEGQDWEQHKRGSELRVMPASWPKQVSPNCWVTD